jgi:hypothetical protein
VYFVSKQAKNPKNTFLKLFILNANLVEKNVPFFGMNNMSRLPLELQLKYFKGQFDNNIR